MIGRDITVLRGPGLDRYGDPVPGSATATIVSGCAVAPRTSDDVTDRGRQGVVVGLTLYAPADADIRHTDQIRVDDIVYDVDGQPGVWASPYTGRAPGQQIALTRAAG